MVLEIRIPVFGDAKAPVPVQQPDWNSSPYDARVAATNGWRRVNARKIVPEVLNNPEIGRLYLGAA